MSQADNYKSATTIREVPTYPAVDPDVEGVLGHLTTDLDPTAVFEFSKKIGVGAVLVQAITQNIRYTISGTDPTITSGFRITAGNDPIKIALVGGRTVLKFIEETAGAILELQELKE